MPELNDEMTVRRILYPTDFSRGAKHALTYAVSLAELFGAELYILHAVALRQDDPDNPAYYFRGSEDELDRRAHTVASAEMVQLVAGEDARTKIFQVHRRGAYAGPVILDYAEEQGIDLIVMGVHGRRGGSRPRLGSVADEVIRRAPCPVLTLSALDEPRTMEAPRRVLVPVDFSAPSRRSLAYAVRLARRFGARLQLLHVIEKVTVPEFYAATLPPHPEDVEVRTLEVLGAWMAEVEGADVPFEAHVAVGRPAMEISAFAERHESDLAVIATQGLTGFHRVAMGGTTEQVVRLCQCPVLVVRADANRPPA
ncbi:MAG TPA: universal stress protein [Thermoanaerobaculia bacterium]|jgi:nucleotide-binding universal stress UspA family protein